jgi:hypothetical protein
MRRPAALLALVLALAVAGCGGGGSGSGAADAYVHEVNAAQAGLAKRFDSLQGAATATSTPAQDRRTLRAYEDAVSAAVTRLRAAEPPADVRSLHQEFVGEIAAYGTEVRHAREALGAGTPQRALAAQRRLVTRVGRITSQINDTIDAINRRLRG